MATPPSKQGTTKTSATSANSLTLSVPAGAQDNDTLVLIATNQNQPPSDWTLPNGFSRIGTPFVVNDSSQRGTIIAAYPVTSAAGLPANFTFSYPGTARIGGILALVRGANNNALDAGHSAHSTTAGAAVTSPAFTAATDSLLLIVSNNQVTSPNADTATISGITATAFDNVASPGDTTVTRTSLKVWSANLTSPDVPAITVTWAGAATGASVMTVALAPASTAPPVLVAYTIWDGTKETSVAVTRWDGAAEQPLQSAHVMPKNMTVQQVMALSRPIYMAHRFGSKNWVEFSARAAKEAAEYWGVDVLEVSVQYSASGTAWLSHDAYLDRMVLGNANGTTLQISALTDTQIRGYTQSSQYTDVTTQPREKLMTLDELNTLYPNMPMIIEDKTYTHQAQLRTWIDAHGGATRFIWKQDGSGTRSTSANGLLAWGYFFEGSTMSSFATKQAQWDFVGLDYGSSDATLQSAIATAGANRVIAHIIPSKAQATRLLAMGVRGLMVADVRGVLPPATMPV